MNYELVVIYNNITDLKQSDTIVLILTSIKLSLINNYE